MMKFSLFIFTLIGLVACARMTKQEFVEDANILEEIIDDAIKIETGKDRDEPIANSSLE